MKRIDEQHEMMDALCELSCTTDPDRYTCNGEVWTVLPSARAIMLSRDGELSAELYPDDQTFALACQELDDWFAD